MSATSEMHIYRGEFVYVDIIQKWPHPVIAEVKLKKLSSDNFAFDDS